MNKIKVGKSGLTEGVLSEIREQVKKGPLEVEIQKGALLKPDGSMGDRKEFGKEIAEKSGAKLRRIIGYKVYLEKKKVF